MKEKEIKITPELVWKRHSAAVEFNTGINLYENVQVNENFYIGKQWEGVKSNGLPTPVFNFLKRVTLFSVSSVSTDNLKLHASPLNSTSDEGSGELEIITDILNTQFAQVFEFNRLGTMVREFARNSAVDGDGVTFTYWDENAETGQKSKGAIKTEVLMNTQVEVANPNSRDLQGQNYIIISRRMLVEDAKKRARKNGIGEQEVDLIKPDEKDSGDTKLDSLGGEKVTALLYLWWDEESGTVHAFECTKEARLREPWDLGIRLYPVTWMCWDYVQDCYHGQALISGLVPNQIFVNRLFAMSMISITTTAYPKIIYDKTRIRHWYNRVGAAIPVTGGDIGNAAKIMDPAAISPQISQFIDLAIQYTQKFLGASDVALGDTRPDNTSAIIALQRASAVPMELTKQNLLQSVEDLGRIYLEFMGEYYGHRIVEIHNPFGGTDQVPFDFKELKKIPMSINLDVGASSYWSEIANMQTLDNLLINNKINLIEYLKRLPSGMITDREALIDTLQREQQMQMQPMGQGQNSSPIADLNLPTEIEGGAGNRELQREINETGVVA